MIQTIVFLSGVAVSTLIASGVFFYKFYRTSHDKFYLWFCLACWLMGLERILFLIFFGPILTAETSPWSYVLRLVAFLMISFAIYDKNKSQRRV